MAFSDRLIITLINTKSRKVFERRIKAGEHAGRVFRLVETASGKTIGEVVQLVHGPLVVAAAHEFLTADGGRTFAQIENYFGSCSVEKLIGPPETDTERIAALQLLHNEWKRRMASSFADSPSNA